MKKIREVVYTYLFMVTLLIPVTMASVPKFKDDARNEVSVSLDKYELYLDLPFVIVEDKEGIDWDDVNLLISLDNEKYTPMEKVSKKVSNAYGIYTFTTSIDLCQVRRRNKNCAEEFGRRSSLGLSFGYFNI